MPVSPPVGLILRGGGSKTVFVAKLLGILGDARLLWMPNPADTTTGTTLDPNTRTVTYDGAVASRLSPLGRGVQQSFVAASSQYGTTPDTANLSFGDGSTDTPFSIVAVGIVNDTASARTIVSKFNTAQLEYVFSITSADALSLNVVDASAAVQCVRVSDAAITQGSFRLFGVTYSGVGGGTAGNGITLYQDGAVIASTATNNPSYVAMENLTAPVEIGSQENHTAAFYDGTLALVAVAAKALTASDHAAIYDICRRYFGL